MTPPDTMTAAEFRARLDAKAGPDDQMKKRREPRSSKKTPERMPIEEFAKTLKAKRPEKGVQKSIMRLLAAKGWLVIRINSGGAKTKSGSWFWAYYILGMPKGMESSGLSDVVAYRGIGGITCEALFVEVKGSDGTLRETQKQFIALAASKGVTVHVADDWQQVEVIVEQLDNKRGI